MTPEKGYTIACLEVEKAAITRVRELNLSSLNLVQLPADIGHLVNLTSLNLSNNNLKTLPADIKHLVNLTSLNLPNNNLEVLPAEIGQLVNLTSIDLSANNLEALPVEIGQLVNLTSLNLSSNMIEYLPVEIGQLINLTLLHLPSNQIKHLPVEIGQLVNLTQLSLSNNKIDFLPVQIGQLTSLISLYLSNNWIKSLPAEIGKLVNLTSLNLSNNQIKSLPAEIGKLINLTFLGLSNNQILALPSEIGYLTNLTTLELVDNELTNLPFEIGKLKLLRRFFLDNNSFSTLPKEIGFLENLRTLTLRPRDQSNETQPQNEINNITSLPDEFRNLHNLERLNLKGTLLPVPPEILENVEKPQAILNYYFSHLKKVLNECKVLVVGQGSVGKTSLIGQLTINKFNPAEPKTEGIVITQWRLEKTQSDIESDQSKITLNLWDFGGQEIMHATHQFFLTKRSLYLLVLDSRLTQEENRVEYWLKIIQSFGGESPVLIVGNKIDQHPLDIDRTGLQKKYPNIVGILETSAVANVGIEELKAAITKQTSNLPHIHDIMPETWFTVKTKLEELGRETNFITHDKYLELCAENEVSDETSQRTLIGFLHDLGVVLHFQDDPRLEALGILNPQWVTNGVYKILNSHNLFQNKGVLTVAMLDEILNLPEYPRGKRLFIVDMMKKFELCYDISYGYDVEPDKTFLVPDLLPKDQPELKFNGVPAFEYAYPVLPSSVITRFIVRMNQKIDDGFVWRTGVVLKIGENKALVKADIEDRKITIAIDGLEHTRRDALSAIRYQLDEIHGSIKGLNPEKYVPVPGVVNAKPLKYEYLLKLERAGKDTLDVEDGDGLKEVNIAQMLNGVESEYQRKQYGNMINISGNITDSTIIAGDDNEVKK